MDQQPPGRRNFLKKMTALGAAGVPVAMHPNAAAAQHAHHVAQTAAPKSAQALTQTRRFLTLA